MSGLVLAGGVIPLLFLFIVNVDGAVNASDFIYVGCSKEKYKSSSPFESSLNSLLTSAIDSASQTTYKSFAFGNDSSSEAAVYGLYQCRGDLEMEECSSCIESATSRISQKCPNSYGALLQMEGCYLRYEHADFLGRLETGLMFKKCSKSVMEDEKFSRRRDKVLDGLQSGGGGGGFRVNSSGLVEGSAQCLGDLSSSDCSKCLAEAVGKLKTVCSSSAVADVFLSKCYARYSLSGYNEDQQSSGGGSAVSKCWEHIIKIVAIGAGVLAALIFLVVAVLCLRKAPQSGCVGACIHGRSKEDPEGERANLSALTPPPPQG